MDKCELSLLHQFEWRWSKIDRSIDRASERARSIQENMVWKNTRPTEKRISQFKRNFRFIIESVNCVRDSILKNKKKKTINRFVNNISMQMESNGIFLLSHLCVYVKFYNFMLNKKQMESVAISIIALTTTTRPTKRS